jgi:hypothetical protein
VSCNALEDSESQIEEKTFRSDLMDIGVDEAAIDAFVNYLEAVGVNFV